MTFINISAGLVTYPAGATFGPRRLKDYEFVYIHSGDVRWQIDDVEHPCPAGTLALVRPEMRDYIIWDQNRTTTHSFVHFSCAIEPDMSDVPLMRFAGDGRIVDALMMQIVHLYSSGKDAHCPVLQSAVGHLLACFVGGELTGVAGASEQLPYPVERVFDFLRNFWKGDTFDDPGVEVLARAAGVTTVHLNRLFRQAFGKTPARVIRSLRMAHAAELLLRSNYQVQEIADLVGSADAYHFSKQFKSIYGISPRTYRQNKAAARPLALASLYYHLKRNTH